MLTNLTFTFSKLSYYAMTSHYHTLKSTNETTDEHRIFFIKRCGLERAHREINLVD